MEHALGQADLPQGEAPGRQQRHPYRIRDAQAGEEIGSVNAGKLLFQVEFTFMVHGGTPFLFVVVKFQNRKCTLANESLL